MHAAIIGGGFAAKLHAEALRKCGAELTLAAASSFESAERAARELGATGFAVCENGRIPAELLSDDIDAVHICTPPNTHAAYARALIEGGKHVLCEKPLSLYAEEADSLSALAERAGVVTATTFNVRYHLACQRAREILASGELGRPLLIHGSYLQEFHALPCPFDWRYDPEIGGPLRAVSEIGTHWFDIAQYISGERIEAVSATLQNVHPRRMLRDGVMYAAAATLDPAADVKRDAALAADSDAVQGTAANPTSNAQLIDVISEDAAAVTLRFSGGAMGSVFLSEISAGRGNRLSLEITCERGNLWWNEEDNNRLFTARKGEGIREERLSFGNGFADTFETLVRAFYAQISAAQEGRDTDLTGIVCPSFAEGAQIARICDAVRRSSTEDSRWVSVNR